MKEISKKELIKKLNQQINALKQDLEKNEDIILMKMVFGFYYTIMFIAILIFMYWGFFKCV